MKRGFDRFEIDDFRDSQWQSETSSRSRESRRSQWTPEHPHIPLTLT
jgi:hypothetical protein